MTKLGRKKKKNLDSMIEWRVKKHLDKVDKHRSISDVRSPWLSADSASPELRNNQDELLHLVQSTLARVQNLPMDNPLTKDTSLIKESELKKFRELNPGSGVDRICEEMDNKYRQKIGLTPNPQPKSSPNWSLKTLLKKRRIF